MDMTKYIAGMTFLSTAVVLALAAPTVSAGQTYACTVTAGSAVFYFDSARDSDSGVAVGACQVTVQAGGWVNWVSVTPGCNWYWFNSNIIVGQNDYVGPGNWLDARCGIGAVFAQNRISIG